MSTFQRDRVKILSPCYQDTLYELLLRNPPAGPFQKAGTIPPKIRSENPPASFLQSSGRAAGQLCWPLNFVIADNYRPILPRRWRMGQWWLGSIHKQELKVIQYKTGNGRPLCRNVGGHAILQSACWWTPRLLGNRNKGMMPERPQSPSCVLF